MIEKKLKQVITQKNIIEKQKRGLEELELAYKQQVNLSNEMHKDLERMIAKKLEKILETIPPIKVYREENCEQFLFKIDAIWPDLSKADIICIEIATGTTEKDNKFYFKKW